MSVLCIGQCGYDMIFCIPGRVQENIKARVTEKYELAGGPAACASALTGLWGLETRLVTRIGDDMYADGIIRELKRFCVDVSFVRRIPGTESSRSFVIRHCDNGDRTAFNYPGSDMDVELELPEHWDVLLMDSHEYRTSLKALEANPSAVTLIDAGTARPNAVALAGKVDYLVCSEVFAGGYTGTAIDLEDPQQLAQQYRSLEKLAPHVVVTLGDRGSLYRQGDRMLRMPAFAMDTVDTLGAGDIFHGTFAYGLHEKMPLEDIVRLSTAASGLSVTKVGGMSSIPDKKEVLEFLRQRADQSISVTAADLS